MRFFSEPILSVVDPSPHPATVHGDLFIQWRILSNANLLKYDDTPLPNSPCMLATLRSDQTVGLKSALLQVRFRSLAECLFSFYYLAFTPPCS